jgi:hypothetical protein
VAILHIQIVGPNKSPVYQILFGWSRRLIWAGNVARIGRSEVHTGFWWGNLMRDEDHLENPGMNGRTLKWIFKNWDEGVDWI